MHFIITFGFLLTVGLDDKAKNNKNEEKKETVIKKKKVEKEKEENESTSESVDSKKNLINVGRLVAEVHVEYELIPGYNFYFDCRCWDTAAKVYTENSERCLKTVPGEKDENTSWVVFSIHHSVELNEAQLRKYYHHTIICRMFFEPYKLSVRARRDNVRAFFIDDASLGSRPDDFVEIYPLSFQDFDFLSNQATPKPETVHDEREGDFCVVTIVDAVPDAVHQHKFRSMLKKENLPSEPLKEGSCSVEVEQKGKPKSMKRKPEIKRGKGKSRDDNRLELTLRAENCFSGMGTITRYEKTPNISGISSILMYVQCENIFPNKEVQMNMNPLAIKLIKVSNFPDEVIIADNFECIYAKIILAGRVLVTPHYKPSSTIYFEYMKTFLYDEFQPEQLISFLITEVLIVEVIGIRTANALENPPSNPDMPETKDSSQLKGELGEVLLGVAVFDVSELLRGCWEVKQRNSLFHPPNIYSKNFYNSVEDESLPLWTHSPLSSGILTTLGTRVKIKVHLSSDLREVHKGILQDVALINRIFYVLRDRHLANDILKDVALFNDSVFTKNSSENGSKEIMSKNLLTGFVVDSNEKVYIFLEGLSNGYLLKVWQKTMNLPVSTAYIYYNSEYFFLDRLYEVFVPLGGIANVKLSESLEKQLSKYSLYISKTGSTAYANFIKTMGLMKLTWTMRSLCHARLFPDPKLVQAFNEEDRKKQ